MFCRFPEFYLVSVNIPDCAIGIIATNTRGVKSDQQRVGDLIMRTGSSDVLFRGHRDRSRLDTRLKKGRKSRDNRIGLEGLESRTLLATIPAAAPTIVDNSPASPINLTSLRTVSDGNANSPTVAVDPYDSQKVFAVWGLDLLSVSPVPHTTAIIEGAFSNNGGTSWVGLGTSVNPVLFDPLNINATVPDPTYTQVTDASVAFDSRGHVYVVVLQTTGVNDGAIVLTEFDFSGNTPSKVFLPNSGIVYQWVGGSDAATSPTLAVDSGTFPSGTTPPAECPLTPLSTTSTSPGPASTRTLPTRYRAPNFNPNRAELVVGTPVGSSLAFSGVTTVNFGGNFGTQRNSHPQLVINPGNTTNSNQTSIDPGQITIGWQDFGSLATATPPVTILLSNIVKPGDSFGFNGSTGTHQPWPGDHANDSGNHIV